MRFDEIKKLNGVKILDTNSFYYEDNKILERIYNCETSEQIPLEKILEDIMCVQEGNNCLSLDDFFSIEEVARENEEFLSRLNKSLKFHSQKNLHFVEAVKKRGKRLKRINSFIEKRIKSFIIYERNEKIEDNISYLNGFCIEIAKSIKSVREKNIINTFSDEERNIYDNLVRYFIYASKEHPLLKDFEFRYGRFKHRKPCDFQTDQKLTAAAFTIAYKSPVIIISSDSDISRLINFFILDKKDKDLFNIEEPVYEVSLYSDFNIGKGFELNMSYLNKNVTINNS